MITINSEKKKQKSLRYVDRIEAELKGKTIRNICFGETTIEAEFEDGSELIFEVYCGMNSQISEHLESELRLYE